MTKTVTFDGAAPEGTINFGIGQPSADLLPVDLVRQASRSFFEDAQPFELNYGVTQGDERFLDSQPRPSHVYSSTQARANISSWW